MRCKFIIIVCAMYCNVISGSYTVLGYIHVLFWQYKSNTVLVSISYELHDLCCSVIVIRNCNDMATLL